MKARFAQFRAELEEKRYRQMVENVTMSKKDTAMRDRREIKSYRDQLGIGLNMVITRLALLVAGWWVGARALGGAWGPVLGVTAMIVGLIAEMGVFLIKARRLEETLEQREAREKLVFPGSVPADRAIASTQTREQQLQNK